MHHLVCLSAEKMSFGFGTDGVVKCVTLILKGMPCESSGDERGGDRNDI